jgi:MT-A70
LAAIGSSPVVYASPLRRSLIPPAATSGIAPPGTSATPARPASSAGLVPPAGPPAPSPKGVPVRPRAWGFDYKTVAFYWVKLNSAAKHDADFFTGLGYWTRANPEQCLLATRGKPTRRAKDVRRLIVEKRREHSRKPDSVRERIERLVSGPYLELFGRETKPGWECWGNQAGLFDAGAVATRRQPSRLADAAQLLV